MLSRPGFNRKLDLMSRPDVVLLRRAATKLRLCWIDIGISSERRSRVARYYNESPDWMGSEPRGERERRGGGVAHSEALRRGKKERGKDGRFCDKQGSTG